MKRCLSYAEQRVKSARNGFALESIYVPVAPTCRETVYEDVAELTWDTVTRVWQQTQ